AVQVRRVDRGDLQLPPGTGTQAPRDVDHRVVVEVQARHYVAGPRLVRLLLDAQHVAVGVELHDAVVLRVGHRVGEDHAARDARVPAQRRAEALAVEDVVAEDQRDRLVADEVRGDDERLGDALRPGLRGVYPDLAPASVTVLDKLTYSGNRANLDPVAADQRLRFVQGDICDADLVDGLLSGVDLVVHFAAESHVDRSIHGAAPFVVTNVLGTQTLLDAALRHRVGRFLHVSTD